MSFPTTRLRRLRATPQLRRLAGETQLSVDDLLYPVFVHTGTEPEPIPSMPGQSRIPVGGLPALARRVDALGLAGIVLFGLPDYKDERGTGAYAPDGIVQQAASVIKDANPDTLVVADTCLDEYTSHGHCGVIVNGRVDNDATLELLAMTAVTQADAGVDIVAPSDMMDGRIGAVRVALDASGHQDTPIMSYAAKYASSFYGPFREAADCAPQFGDRRGYQMDPGNRREALREVALDVEEGADIVMVKPALPYLDVVREVRDAFDLPVAAYNVSGEYSMVKAAAQQGWIDERSLVLEVLTSIKRAGAGTILTYHACEAACWLQERS